MGEEAASGVAARRPRSIHEQAAQNALASQRAAETDAVRHAQLEQDRRAEAAARAEERVSAKWEDLLCRWHAGDDSVVEGPAVKELCHQGVPEAMRSDIWPLLIGNDLRITERLYKLLCEKASALWPSIRLRHDAERALHIAKQTQRRRERHRRAAARMAPALPLSAAAEAGQEEPARPPVQSMPSSAPSPSTAAPRPLEAGPATALGSQGGSTASGARAGDPPRPEPLVVAPCSTQAEASAEEGARREAEEDEEAVRLAQRQLLATPIVGSEMSMLTIDADVPRTFPELSYFRAGSTMHASLRNMLSAFAVYRPDIGYTQGMSFVAATILLHVENEALAFGAFANLMLRPAVFEAFGDGRDVSNAKFHARLVAFKRVIARCQPRIAKRLEELKVTPEMFIASW